MTKTEQAQAIADGKLFDELLAEYQANVYRRWINAETTGDMEKLQGQARGATDFAGWLKNKCKEVANGS